MKTLVVAFSHNMSTILPELKNERKDTQPAN